MTSPDHRANGYRIGAVLFDFDGTLTLPDALDFTIIRNALNCPEDQSILTFISRLEAAQQDRARAILDRFEAKGAADSQPAAGAESIVRQCRRHGLPVGLITRNSRAAVDRALANFDHLDPEDFDLILTRDDPLPPKPDPDGIIWAADRLGANPEEVLVVGDYLYDIQAGENAGALTALLVHQPADWMDQVRPDFKVTELAMLAPIIEAGLALPPGKLPNRLLGPWLKAFAITDPSVLVRPSVGEDTAAVDIDKDQVLVLKSDPITFATDGIGRYAVMVNANDIATAGARPRWMLTTLLMPAGISASHIHAIFRDLHTFCSAAQITLCGGHTEITEAVNRPVVCGMLAGTICRDRLIDKRRMQPGDVVLMTKSAGVEGTAIMAREFEDRLLAAGLEPGAVQQAKHFLDRISVLDEAAIAADKGRATALHDVTEGGLATALEELSIAGGHRLEIDIEAIPVHRLTRRICDAMGVDPLGLIGSGALLITCRQHHAEELMAELKNAGIQACTIGKVTAAGDGVSALCKGRPVKWPRFEADEIARLY